MDITKLADKWEQDELTSFGDAVVNGFIAGEELTASLPVWIKITDDPDTWPEDDQDVIVSCAPNNSRDFAVWQEPFKQFDLYVNDGYVPISNAWQHPIHWRPLCGLDRPPELQP